MQIEARAAQASLAEMPAALAFGSASGEGAEGGSK